MTYLGNAGLVSAVSNAGGLGVISGNASPDWVREQIVSTRLLTDKPFGVNIVPTSPFTEEVINIILKEKVPIVTIGGGTSTINIPELKGAGLIVMPVVSNVASAMHLESLGVDAIIAEGTEAGGHIGRITTMALVPQVVDSVRIPVVAAGGIAEGRGLVAAFALGAQGVQIGTRFICSEECIAHPDYKEKIVEAEDCDTTVIEQSTGHPVRCLMNKMTRKSSAMERAGALKEDLEKLSIGKFYSGAIKGDVDEGLLVAGQVAGLIKEIKPAREIIKQLVVEAERVIAGLDAIAS
jgi:enoyl-[acyl-carrier protein] reductase II